MPRWWRKRNTRTRRRRRQQRRIYKLKWDEEWRPFASCEASSISRESSKTSGAHMIRRWRRRRRRRFIAITSSSILGQGGSFGHPLFAIGWRLIKSFSGWPWMVFKTKDAIVLLFSNRCVRLSPGCFSSRIKNDGKWRKGTFGRGWSSWLPIPPLVRLSFFLSLSLHIEPNVTRVTQRIRTHDGTQRGRGKKQLGNTDFPSHFPQPDRTWN